MTYLRLLYNSMFMSLRAFVTSDVLVYHFREPLRGLQFHKHKFLYEHQTNSWFISLLISEFRSANELIYYSPMQRFLNHFKLQIISH